MTGGLASVIRLLSRPLARPESEGMDRANASGGLTFVLVVLVLMAVANLASYLPARRAARVDPATVLRVE